MAKAKPRPETTAPSPRPETIKSTPRAESSTKPPTPLSAWPAGNGDAAPTIGEIGLNQFAPYLLNRLLSRWNGDVQDLLKGIDISTTKMRALAVLTVASGITVNELAVFAVTEQSTMSRTLDALEEDALIRRKAKAGDMRVREVFITDKGLTLFASFWPDIYALYGRFFEGVPDMEFRGFIATLHKVLRNVQG